MKNLMLLSAMLFTISFSACSQKQPSGDIQKAFNEKFPTAKSVKWDMEEENEWEAEFKMDGAEMSAVFDAKGVWLETEKEISKKQIPEAIKATLDRDYQGYKVEEIEWLETPEQNGFELKIQSKFLPQLSLLLSIFPISESKILSKSSGMA